jgi:G3E family GTPase
LQVITGFLGAGKTTLLNRLLRDPALADTVVIVNEFGEVGLDHLLMQGVDDGMILMESGCLCCTLRGDLIVTLEDLLRRRDNGRIAPFRRVVIETTGLADPAPILHTVLMHPYLSQRFDLDGVVTLVDAVNAEATLAEQEEAVRQVAVADRVVLTKTDLASAAQIHAARRLIEALNPGVPLLDAAAGKADASALIGLGLYDLAARPREVEAWLAIEAVTGGAGPHRHDPNREGDIAAVALTADQPIRGQTFDLFWTLMTSTHGPKLLRMKGLLCLAEQPERPVVVQAARQVLHPPQELAQWPSADRSTRIVLIAKGLDPQVVRQLWGAFLGSSVAA